MTYRQTHREIQRQIGIHRQIDIGKADKLTNKQIERQAHKESVEGCEMPRGNRILLYKY